jgi:hypothetical protein
MKPSCSKPKILKQKVALSALKNKRIVVAAVMNTNFFRDHIHEQKI